MNLYVLQLLNGLAYGMILFLLAAGLSLTFGVGRILNLAHGGFYMLGGYLGYSVVRSTGSFWLAVAAAPAVGAAVGLAAERLLLRRLHGHGRELDQVLLTFGLAFVLADATRMIWGSRILSLNPPAALARPVIVGSFIYPAYPLFVIGVGLALALALWGMMRGTRVGAAIRAAAWDGEMAATLGVPTDRVLMGTFGAGVGLASLGGAIGAPIIALAPGLDFTLLVLALIVVATGGLGRVEGAFWSALLVGVADVFGKLFFPRLALVFIFAFMALVLVLRPQGLLGKRA